MSSKSSAKIEAHKNKALEENPPNHEEQLDAVSGTHISLRGRVGAQKRGVVKTSCVEDAPKRQRESKEDLSTSVLVDLEEDDEEDCYPVTVETKSACLEEEGAILLNHVQVNMLSHCIFCLRKTAKDSGKQEKPGNFTGNDKASRANLAGSSSPQLLATFNRVLEYFRTSYKCEQDPLNLLEPHTFRDVKNKKNTMTFLDLPILCRFCADKMEKVNKLVEELKTQLNVLHEVMQASKRGGKRKNSQRVELLESSLRKSNLPGNMIAATIDVLTQLEFIGGGRNDKIEPEPLSTTDLLNDLKVAGPARSLFCEEVEILVEVPEENRRYTSRLSTESRNELDPLSNNNEGSYCENFVGEDDWSEGEVGGCESDPDPEYIKSEPEDDFSEDNYSSTDSTEAKIPTRTIADRKNGACSSSPSVKNKNVCKSSKKCKEEKGISRRTQACDLCNIEVPVSKIFQHVREHVGDEYLIKCPYPKCTHVYSNHQPVHIHFLRNKNSLSHRSSHVNEQEFLQKFTCCQLCGHKATNAFALRGHILRMHETPTKNFACSIQGCPQKFTVQQSVQFHIKHHDVRNAVDKQKCAECNTKILLTKMEGHLKEVHHAKEVIKCKHCPLLFSTREWLVVHLFAHRFRVLACDICGDHVKFSRHAQLREHYFRVHQVGKQYVCEQCGNAFLTKESLVVHTKNFHKKKESSGGAVSPDVKKSAAISIKCDICDYVCNGEHALRDHAIEGHGAEPYSCKMCSATFTTFSLLYRHEKGHKVGSHKEQFRCEVEGCGKSYKVKAKLRTHIATAHRGERPHVCELCGKSYATDGGLHEHKNAFHLGLRPHNCTTCGESFTSRSTLTRHKLIHTGERPFCCEICGQRFRHREVLKTHIEGHKRKGADFKPNGPMKRSRKRVEKKT